MGAMCVGLTAVLTGCGGGGEDPDANTNGVGKLPARTIESKAAKAARGADTVHLTGTLVSKGSSYKLDMRLSDKGGVGEVATKDSRFELLRVGKELYLKADADFWTRKEGSESDQAAARKLDGKYVKVPAGDPSYQQLGGFTEKDVLLDGVLGLHGALSTGDRGKIAGVRTIRVLAAEGSGGSLDVSLEGTPYPLRLKRAGGAGTILLADWNKTFPLAAPGKEETVDYGQQIPAHE
ncbi:hypothetical protein [Streptomyces palmae]|uniref:Lipoprotein n=1 Tax=Streptomyces palmae TaxID=1701085 RepID=A0A4Z0H968_9ACTN|nr:hypothetical protein [Streptomyces palmae]TGB08905.1 hypothetical protein E4099_14605 [Streptomyces palmae]